MTIDIDGSKIFPNAPSFLGSEISANETIKTGFSAAEFGTSIISLRFLPEGGAFGVLAVILNGYNFVSQTQGGDFVPALASANTLSNLGNLLSGNPILEPLGAAGLGFEVGDFIARLKVPGTQDSTFGTIYADFFTAPERIKLKR